MCTMEMEMPVTTGSHTAIVAEAGSREAPAMPPGLLTDMGEAGARPTKLFIGGISRHTTTKQLRDHFSAFGRVLDCVAMRQPDGRPRGFGYVTLDSPIAADHCLAEPQMIDNRIVDMKLAVPEGSCASGQTSPSQGAYTPKMFGGQDFHMGMLGQGYHGWPEASGAFYNPSLMYGGSGKTSPVSQGLDCADLLTAARDLAMSHGPPNGLLLQSRGNREYGDFAADPLDAMGCSLYGTQSQRTLIPEEFQQPAGAAKKMSANAAEFVPSGTQAAQLPVSETVETPAKPVGVTPQSQKPRRAPLGELTNIVVEVGDLLKPFESPTNKRADVGQGHLNFPNQSETGLSNRLRPTGLLLGDEDDESSPSSSYDQHRYSPGDSSSPETESAEKKEETRAEETVENVDDVTDVVKKLEDDEGPVSSDAGDEDDSSADGEDVVVDMDNLPSLGSAQHATGECKRCNFFPKGRCQNGLNCTFCHFSHDKRKPSRQEKRDRRALWLEQQGQTQEQIQEQMSFQEQMHPQTGPLLSSHGLHGFQQGCFPVYTDEDIFSQETLAYSIFPGMPPIHATKLPAPLPLPGMDMAGYSQQGPALPPGLTPPGTLSTQPSKPKADASAAAHSFLSTGPTMPGMLGNTCVQQAVSSISRTAFATVPTPLRVTPATSAASTPMPTPMATPTAAMQAEARPFIPAGTMVTGGTQTGDYMCNKCEADFQNSESTEDGNGKGSKTRWSREEMLRLRDGLATTSEAGKANILPHTVAVTACPVI